MSKRIVVTGKALERLQEAIDDVDYCFLCDNHVSSGHSKDCPLVVTSDDCRHSWIVFSTAVATGQIMVECSVCKATGTVDTHTRAEWQAAFHAPSNPYRWDGGDDRITVTGGKVDDGKNI